MAVLFLVRHARDRSIPPDECKRSLASLLEGTAHAMFSSLLAAPCELKVRRGCAEAMSEGSH